MNLGAQTCTGRRSNSTITVWKMNADGGTAHKMFTAEKVSEFPSDDTSVRTAEEPDGTQFKSRYLSRLSNQIGQFFYGYE